MKHVYKKPRKIGCHFIPLPSELLKRRDISLQAAVVMAEIMNQARMHERGVCRLSNSRLGVVVHRTEKSVQRYLNELKAAGLINCIYTNSGRARYGIKPLWRPGDDEPAAPGETFTPPAATGDEDWNAPGLDDGERYRLYLCSRHWGVRREAVRARSGGRCERCKAAPMECVHHKTYARKYEEPLEDLAGLCNACHSFLHGRASHDPAAALAVVVDPFAAFSVVC